MCDFKDWINTAPKISTEPIIADMLIASLNKIKPDTDATTGSMHAVTAALVVLVYFKPPVYSMYGKTAVISANSIEKGIRLKSATIICDTFAKSAAKILPIAANTKVYAVMVTSE